MNLQQREYARRAGLLTESSQIILIEGLEFDPFLLEGILDNPKAFLQTAIKKINNNKKAINLVRVANAADPKKLKPFKQKLMSHIKKNIKALKKDGIKAITVGSLVALWTGVLANMWLTFTSIIVSDPQAIKEIHSFISGTTPGMIIAASIALIGSAILFRK